MIVQSSTSALHDTPVLLADVAVTQASEIQLGARIMGVNRRKARFVTIVIGTLRQWLSAACLSYVARNEGSVARS